jgi:hypothetical protein
MSLTLRAALLIVLAAVCAQAQTRTLGLYAGPARGLNDQSRLAMQEELARLLAPAGIEIIWKDSSARRSGEDFELIAVSSFEGSCSLEGPHQIPVSKSLADTSISDGHVLPFFRVDCTRLIQMLGRHISSSVLGRALARVMAHEIYHIVARTPEHQETGVAKAVFAAQDLTDSGFEFDSWSILLMRPSSVAGVSDALDAVSR